jgi:hypothetical protein
MIHKNITLNILTSKNCGGEIKIYWDEGISFRCCSTQDAFKYFVVQSDRNLVDDALISFEGLF